MVQELQCKMLADRTSAGFRVCGPRCAPPKFNPPGVNHPKVNLSKVISPKVNRQKSHPLRSLPRFSGGKLPHVWISHPGLWRPSTRPHMEPHITCAHLWRPSPTNLSHTMYQLNSFRTSTPPRNRHFSASQNVGDGRQRCASRRVDGPRASPPRMSRSVD